MGLMAWSRHFATGIDSIDAQHKGLVDLVNASAPYLAEVGEAPAREVRPLLDRLAAYTVSHFQHEEGMMVAGGIDPHHLAQHRRSHATFARDVTQMILDSGDDHNVSGVQLLRYLTSWLTFHILTEDQDMVRQLRAIESGTSAAAALGSIVSDEATTNAVLVGALVDLFSLVSLRNQVLNGLNEDLQQTKTDLALANEQLEARVSERTSQLREANTELERERLELAESLVQVQRAQMQLAQSEKMAAVGQLAAGVAHEINNPIGFVTSNLGSLDTYSERLFSLLGVYDQLVSSLPVDHPQRRVIERACESAEVDYLRHDIPDLLRESRDGLARVARIVSDLRDFAREDDGVWQDADINHGLESALNALQGRIGDQVKVDMAHGDLPPLRCLPGQINRVFLNLLTNALQAIESTGVLTLRTAVVDDKIEICISDTGPGIPEALQKRIFEPFFTTRPVGQGTGLGLSVCWDIIERHAGRIEVDSRPGAGSTFTVTLPIASGTAAVKIGAE